MVMLRAHIIHIIGLCLWLAAGCPDCVDPLDTAEKLEFCTRQLLTRHNTERYKKPLAAYYYHFSYGQKYHSDLLNASPITSVFDGSPSKWSLSNYSFTGHDNYNIEDVAVRKEGKILKITFSVRWLSPVTVTVSARQTGQMAGTMNIHIRNLAGKGEVKYNTDSPDKSSEAHKVNVINYMTGLLNGGCKPPHCWE